MVLLDTNIFIYLARGDLSPAILGGVSISHASISKIEALGYSKIPADELILLGELFAESYDIALDEDVIGRAIALRQRKQMTLGDAIIAATALEHQLPVWTANTEDFQHIEGLKLVNPLLKP